MFNIFDVRRQTCDGIKINNNHNTKNKKKRTKKNKPIKELVAP